MDVGEDVDETAAVDNLELLEATTLELLEDVDVTDEKEPGVNIKLLEDVELLAELIMIEEAERVEDTALVEGNALVKADELLVAPLVTVDVLLKVLLTVRVVLVLDTVAPVALEDIRELLELLVCSLDELPEDGLDSTLLKVVESGLDTLLLLSG
ncbi:hypothetical protein LTR95_012662, partial [Oleoguttula sp. CCFEE 5521]